MSAPLWLLTLITFSGTLAMHIFVPALPEAARDLGASIGGMQLTVSVYILGLAVGQLAYGPLSDRFGRRPVLMAGLALYALAGLAAAFAPGRPQPDRRPAAAGAGRLRRAGDRPRHRARHGAAAGSGAPPGDDEPDGRHRPRRRAASSAARWPRAWAGARSSSRWRCSASSTCCSAGGCCPKAGRPLRRPDAPAWRATTAACSCRPPSWALRSAAAAPRRRCTPSSAPRPSSSPIN